jgi:hypothetical protein
MRVHIVVRRLSLHEFDHGNAQTPNVHFFVIRNFFNQLRSLGGGGEGGVRVMEWERRVVGDRE